MTNLDLAREFLKENPDMTVGDAVYIKTFARWLDQRSQREPDSKPRCRICGTHEVDQAQTCHNSQCESYARGVTIYEGWRTPEPAAPVAHGINELASDIERQQAVASGEPLSAPLETRTVMLGGMALTVVVEASNASPDASAPGEPLAEIESWRLDIMSKCKQFGLDPGLFIVDYHAAEPEPAPPDASAEDLAQRIQAARKRGLVTQPRDTSWWDDNEDEQPYVGILVDGTFTAEDFEAFAALLRASKRAVE